MNAKVKFEIFNHSTTSLTSGPDAEASPRPTYGISVIVIWISQVLQILYLWYYIEDGEAELWLTTFLDPSSSMRKCYSQKKVKEQSQIQRPALIPLFGISVVAIWISRTQLYEINYEETLKGHKIIIGGEYIETESDAEASPRPIDGTSIVVIWISQILILLYSSMMKI